MAYETYEKLEYKAKAGISIAKQELLNRKNNKVKISLPGIHGAALYYVPGDSLNEQLFMIDRLYKSVSNEQKVKSVILLDAYHSATIEGAKTTIEQVGKVIAKPETKHDKMVINTFKTLQYAYTNEITASNIRKIWEKLVKDVCENTNKQGTLYRDGMVFIGNEAETVHIPASPENIPQCMNELFLWLDGTKWNPWLMAAICHFYFVYIHPFCDGNGRMARIWVQSFLYHFGLKKMKYIPIPRSINKNLSGYYRSIKESEKIHANGEKWIDVTFFIDYFLEMVIDCLMDTIREDIRLNEKDQKLLQKMQGKEMEISVKNAAKIMNLSPDSARKHLDKLVEQGVLDKKKKGQAYIYTSLTERMMVTR